MKKFAVLIAFSLVPLFSFDNHFLGVIATSGNLDDPSTSTSPDDQSLSIDDSSYVSAGIKTGIITDNVIAYVDYQHFSFSISDGNKNYNEDILSFAVGPIFSLNEYFDLSFYVNGVAVADKFHYSKEEQKVKYNEYLSQYQLFLGYEFGIIFPILLNPFHSDSDSFVEVGYRSVFRNDSIMDSANTEDSKVQIPFKGMSSFFLGINFLF